MQLGAIGGSPSPGTGHLPGDRDELRPGWDTGGPYSLRSRGWAGLGCGELETVALLGQRQRDVGADMAS